MRLPQLKIALAGLAVSLAATGCSAATGTPSQDSDGADGSSSGARLSIVGFSVLEAANEPVLADFDQTPEGTGSTFTTSYGSSGDQSRAVEDGLPADLVHFSLEPDVTRLVDAGLVDSAWKDTPTDGIATSSVAVLVVRKGNPEGITGWDDLVKPGVEVITPNPASSGSAKWNILAAWGHVIQAGGTQAEAKAFVSKLLSNTIALPSSGREATTAFSQGNGDVLISYENEAIAARAAGEEFDYVVPDDTLLIENPAAVTSDADPVAADLLAFLTTPAAQEDYATFGFRPVIDGVDLPEVEGANDPADPFPTPAALLTIDDDFEGWDVANTKFFDEDKGIIPTLQKQTGTLGDGS